MSLELPRLPSFSILISDFQAFIGSFRHWYDNLQIWWQQTVEAVEAHEIVQDAILSNLDTAQGDLTINQLAIEEAQDEIAQAQADLDEQQDTLTDTVATLQATVDALAALDSTVTGIQNSGPYVLADFGPAWVAATGTASRATFATYTAPTITNPPTQAEVQAIANAVQTHSQVLKALIDDLTANNVLTL